MLPRFLIALIPLTVATSAALAREVEALAPVTPWSVDWSSSSCKLRRDFGNPQSPDRLVIERFGSTEFFNLVISGRNLKGARSGSQIALRVGDDKPIQIPYPVIAPGPDGRTTVLIVSTSLGGASMKEGFETQWPTTSPEQQSKLHVLAIDFGNKSVALATGRLDKPFANLRKCTDDLVRSWGLDPAEQAALSDAVIPVNDPAAWIVPEDYPAHLRGSGRRALVAFRLLIDAQGKPIDCQIQQTIGDTAFDRLTCSGLMGRAKFKPASDMSGKPVPSYFVNTVRWAPM